MHTANVHAVTNTQPCACHNDDAIVGAQQVHIQYHVRGSVPPALERLKKVKTKMKLNKDFYLSRLFQTRQRQDKRRWVLLSQD